MRLFYFRNLTRKLGSKDFIIHDLLGEFAYIETEQQIIYICAGNSKDKANHQMMDYVERKINKVNNFYLNFPFEFFENLYEVWCFA